MIRTNTLVDDFEYVSIHDEAIDAPADGSDPAAIEAFQHKWKLYRDGMGDPPLKAGVKPTRFKLRHITSAERIYLMELQSGDEKGVAVAAAAMAIVGASDLADSDGKKIEIRQEATSVGPVKIRHASKESMDALPMEVLLEIGALVMERSTIRPPS